MSSTIKKGAILHPNQEFYAGEGLTGEVCAVGEMEGKHYITWAKKKWLEVGKSEHDKYVTEPLEDFMESYAQ